MDVQIGINDKDRKEMSEMLCKILADTYTFYLKTQNYHWNVTGPEFVSLHHLFEDQYKDLAEAVDEIAERIRSLGFAAPGSYAAFGELTQIKEETGTPKAAQMVKNLVEDHGKIITLIRSAQGVAGRIDDEATGDMLTERLEAQEKFAWMLRSVIE